jgi:phosphoribosylformylglycinamidine cyclo-ligase
LQENGKISQSDMLRIFNCGIGMVCILDKADVLKAKKVLSKHKLRTYEIGSIIKGDLKEQIQYQ